MKQQRTPPNSTGTSLSPLSQSFLTRLPSSISESNPIRIGNLLPSNTIRLSSPTTTKPIETINVLLKQNLPSTPIVQVKKLKKNAELSRENRSVLDAIRKSNKISFGTDQS